MHHSVALKPPAGGGEVDSTTGQVGQAKSAFWLLIQFHQRMKTFSILLCYAFSNTHTPSTSSFTISTTTKRIWTMHDYEEPPWQGGKVEAPKISNNDVLANMKRHAEQAGNQKSDGVIRKCEEVMNALAELEPIWTSCKCAPASEVLKKTLMTFGFLNGLVCLCASVAYSGNIHDYDLTPSSVGPLSGSPLAAPRALAMQQEPPPHLNEDLLSEAKEMFNPFVDSVGNRTNGKSNRWELKAQAVHDFEKYVRKKWAVKAGSFSFFGNETGKLTDSRIWWRKDSAVSFEIL